MAVAMQVDCTPAHIPPSAERVVAQHEPYTIDRHFRICLHAVPFVTLAHSSIVVVADQEVLVAVQGAEQELYALN